jgi:predicted nucleic acid-binding Zn ribbon protein
VNSTPDPSASSEATEDLSIYSARRQRRIRITAWVVIVALILVGGGSTVLTVLLG